VGVARSTAKDVEDLFDGIPLDQVSTNFTVNATAPMIPAQYIVAGKKQRVPPEKLTGTLRNDILKEYAARGTWSFPPPPSIRLTADVIEYCATGVPKFNPISVSSSHPSEAAASVLQAIADTFADAVTYVQLVSGRGIDLEAFASRLSFNLGASSVIFFERLCALRRPLSVGQDDARAPVFVLLPGSYFVVWLTMRSEQELENIIHDLEQRGGMVQAIENGYLQQIAQRALQVQQAIERADQVVVGGNKLRLDEVETHEIAPHQNDPATENVRSSWCNRGARPRQSARVRHAGMPPHRGRGHRKPKACHRRGDARLSDSRRGHPSDVFVEFHEPVTL
jgi:methylmalonyl-CoA mutase N-terminal domain/subunit